MIDQPIVLHDFWRSSSAWRVRIALNLKGLEYRLAAHNLLAGEQREDAYRALAPQGLVPALEVGGTVLTQSLAIIEWLDEQIPDPPLLPSDAEGRARARAMADLIACDVQPLQNLRVLRALKKQLGAEQAAIDAWSRHWVSEGFAALETIVAGQGREYCVGDRPGLVECVLIPQMHNALRYATDLSPYPCLRAVRDRCDALPQFIAAHPSSQPDAQEASGA